MTNLAAARREGARIARAKPGAFYGAAAWRLLILSACAAAVLYSFEFLLKDVKVTSAVIIASTLINQVASLWITGQYCAWSSGKSARLHKGVLLAASLVVALPAVLLAAAQIPISTLNTMAPLYAIKLIMQNPVLGTAAIVLIIFLWVMFQSALYIFARQWVILSVENPDGLRGAGCKLFRESFRHVFTPIGYFFAQFPWTALSCLAAAGLAGYAVLQLFSGVPATSQWILFAALIALSVWMLGYGVVFWARYWAGFMDGQREVMKRRGLLG